MALGQDYITYPQRHLGMDHDRYPYRATRKSAPLAWPNGARLAVFITVHVEWFPLDMTGKPVAPFGAFDRPYPDTQNYTARDYGNRVGIYRMMDAFARHGIKPTAAMNSKIAERYPLLMQAINEEGWEVMAAGVDMGHLHYGGLDVDAERAQVREAVSVLRAASGQKVLGWHSPSHSESLATPDLIAAEGIRYFADWTNDEKPYDFRTDSGPLVALPAPYELSDRKIIHQHLNSLADFEQQVLAAFNVLYNEAAPEDGRILALSLSPWLIGQPYRISGLERILASIFAAPDVVSLTAAQIAEIYQAASL